MALRPVENRPGAFDDRGEHGAHLWGAYATTARGVARAMGSVPAGLPSRRRALCGGLRHRASADPRRALVRPGRCTGLEQRAGGAGR
jgi:hypothetical protein